MLHPRQLVAGLRRIDRVRVDELVGLLLLVVIELQVWLTPSVSHRLLHTLLGLVFALAVAVRRRRPLELVLVILGFVVAKTVVGGPQGLQPVGNLEALLLIFYGMGAFAPERRSLPVAVLAVVVTAINQLTIPGQPASTAVFASLFVVPVPYALGRMMRARAARERAAREQAERLDAARELKLRPQPPGACAREGAARRNCVQRVGDGDPGRRGADGDEFRSKARGGFAA